MRFLKKEETERETINQGSYQETAFLITHVGDNTLIRTGLVILLWPQLLAELKRPTQIKTGSQFGRPL
jgi:hypothetical protein